jgi:hypothetical protein
VSISTGYGGAIDGGEVGRAPGRAATGGEPAVARRRAAQPTRRAVLHVRAPGDPVVPPGLASWFTERGFDFYQAVVTVPARPVTLGPGLAGGRLARGRLGPAFADLDAVCARLRQADGMDQVIVSAQGGVAAAVAQWAGQPETCADALILYQPALPARRGLRLDIGCPVLVLSGARASRPAGAARLGSHVTWVQLTGAAELDLAGGLGEAVVLDRGVLYAELGRWLGAYMYARDRLL